MKMKPLPVVEVDWCDSTHGCGWRSEQATEEWRKDFPFVIHSVGYLISNTKDEITLAQGFSTRSKNTHELFQIPRGCVKKVRKLK